jgi:amino acid permease
MIFTIILVVASVFSKYNSEYNYSVITEYNSERFYARFLFIAITQNMKKHERKAVSKTAIITSGTVLIMFAIGGTAILSIFGTTILSFIIPRGCFYSLQPLNC